MCGSTVKNNHTSRVSKSVPVRLLTSYLQAEDFSYKLSSISLQKIGLVLRPSIKVVDSDFSFPDSADQQTNNRCWPDSGHNYIIRKKFLSVNHRSPSRFPSLVVALSDEWRLYSETSCLLFLFVSFLNINITENSCEEKIRFSDL